MSDMNLKELLLDYFSKLDGSMKVIVSYVYALERQNSDMQRPRIIQQIKDKIDAEATLILQNEGRQP